MVAPAIPQLVGFEGRRGAGEPWSAARRILELNPNHPILEKLWQRWQADQSDPILDESAQLLFGFGLLAEGGELPEPAKFNRAVAELMARSL